jgi:hypothetical protein
MARSRGVEGVREAGRGNGDEGLKGMMSPVDDKRERLPWLCRGLLSPRNASVKGLAECALQ